MSRPKAFFQRGRRIALLNRSAIGDLILCLPVLSKLKRLNPELEFDLYCDRANSQLAGLVVLFDNVYVIKPIGNTYLSIILCALKARARRYDVFVCMKVGFGRQGGLFAMFAGAKTSTGFVSSVEPDWENARSFFTDSAYTLPVTLTRSMYELRHYSATISDLFFDGDTPLLANEFLNDSYPMLMRTQILGDCAVEDSYVVLTVGPSNDPRKMSDQFLLELIDCLSLGDRVQIVLSGLEQDLERFRAYSLNRIGSVIFANTPSIADLLTLVQGALIVCGGDGGTMHLAALARKPLIVLMSKENGVKWRPLAKIVKEHVYQKTADEVDLRLLKEDIENLTAEHFSGQIV